MDNYTPLIENRPIWWKKAKNDTEYGTLTVNLDGNKYIIVIFNNEPFRKENQNRPNLKININRIEGV
jgi:hypothetical protein